MTSLAERVRPKSGGVFVAGQPQVNLLPPEVAAARGLKAVKRVLGVLVLLVVAACAGAYVLATLDKSAAMDDLTAAQDETTRLQADIQSYAEVPLVRGQLEDAKLAREMAMSTEVLWQQYYGAITAVLPPTVSINTLVMTQSTPMALPPAPKSPLEEPSIGQIVFTARSATVPDTAAWVDALNSIPGLGDAWVSTTSVNEDAENEIVFYDVSASVQVRESAFAHRFVEAPDEASGDATDATKEGE